MPTLLAHQGQYLHTHLLNVAGRSRSFAEAFDAAELGHLAGLLHDVGKAERPTQDRISGRNPGASKIPHAPHGAALALESNAWPLAFAINGHHAGLHDRGNLDPRRKEISNAKSCVEAIIRDSGGLWSVPESFGPALPSWLASMQFDSLRRAESWFAAELFTRFLFSALIDADRLDTEENEKGECATKALKSPTFAPDSLLRVLEDDLSRRASESEREQTASLDVQRVRNEVRETCKSKATIPRGLFSLTVPTGGGKTLASMLFALAHAAYHNRNLGPNQREFRRIIVVIPYLSIIQQTAGELKKVFGDEMVLEHHSQANMTAAETKGKADDLLSELAVRRQLATENWDAPIIVTTSVQFFDSLFSRSPSDARKLHNICQSIVIFDEVQTLPPLLLPPMLNVLQELANPARPYGCSLVFCTATQPALAKSDDLACGLPDSHPIVKPETAKSHFEALDRVEYDWQTKPLSWVELAEKIVGEQHGQHRQVLVIVNTRKAARELHACIQDYLDNDSDGLFHLSTWMMPDHRNKVLDEVRRRLDPKTQSMPPQKCILVSTQCIEAGVDVDFPEVWRAFGPYDAIVQAAGRCNRNGRLKDDAGHPAKGHVHIFFPEDYVIPKGIYSTAVAQTKLLRKMNKADPKNPESFRTYFRLLYQLSVPESCAIQQNRSHFHFEQVDSLFEFIERDNTISVVVLLQRFPDTSEHVPTLAKKVYDQALSRVVIQPKGKSQRSTGYFTREDWRSMQPFIFNLLKGNTEELKRNGKLIPAFADESTGLYVWNGQYDAGLTGTGINFEGPPLVEGTII